MQKYILSTIIVLSFGCHKDFDKPLPNGYSLVRTDPDTIFICDPVISVQHKDTVDESPVPVPPKISKVGIHQDLVFGLVKNTPEAVFGKYSYDGYFILDTANKKVLNELKHDDFLKHLQAAGVISKGQEPTMMDVK